MTYIGSAVVTTIQILQTQIDYKLKIGSHSNRFDTYLKFYFYSVI